MTSSNKSIKWFNGPTRSGYFSQSTVSSRSASLAPSEILPSRDSNLISLLFPASCFLIRGNNVSFRTRGMCNMWYPFVPEESYPINNTISALNNTTSTHHKSTLNPYYPISSYPINGLYCTCSFQVLLSFPEQFLELRGILLEPGEL